MESGGSSDYFRLPHRLWMVLVPVGLVQTTVAATRPDLLSYVTVEPITSFMNYMVKDHPAVVHNIFIFMIVAHLGEGLVSFFVSRNKGLTWSTSVKWTLSVLLFGVFNFYHLLRYKPGGKKFT